MDILNMLFKSIVKINPEPKNESKTPQKDEQKVEQKNEHPVKLQCVVCSDTFNIYTEHNCLFRESNQEFIIKYK